MVRVSKCRWMRNAIHFEMGFRIYRSSIISIADMPSCQAAGRGMSKKSVLYHDASNALVVKEVTRYRRPAL